MDVNIDKNNVSKFCTTVYRKSTFTGLLTNLTTFVPLSYKLALVKTLIHRVYHICNSKIAFDKNINELKEILKKNLYPIKLIDKEVRKYLDKKLSVENEVEEKPKLNYYKLPYIGKFSQFAQRKIKELSSLYCKGTNIKLSFSLTKSGSLFSVKDKIPTDLKSFVVYKFCCAGCNTSYVGETTRHLKIRIKEHLRTDKDSIIFKHLESNINCKKLSNETCFSIIDQAQTEFTLKLKEAMHIEWLKPSLNKQQKHVNVSISV